MFTKKEIKELKKNWKKIALAEMGLDNSTHSAECYKWYIFCAIYELCDIAPELYTQVEQIQKVKKLPLKECIQKIIKNI